MVPDYYAMLGVDPGADRSALADALARRQPVWSSGTRNPKNKHTYQSYLDQIPALRRALLGDPAARAAYDAELAEARRADRDARLDALQRAVRLRAAKGGLSVGDRDLLRGRAGALGLTPQDLDRLIEPIPPRPEPAADLDPPDPPVDALDPTARRQIRVALDHLHRRDLYDALDLPRDSPEAEIADRAGEARRRWMQKAQVTAEKTAWLEVISQAQSLLTSASTRARYDRTLDLDAEESLAESIAFALQGLDRLDPGTQSALVDEATARGIPPDRAERLIRRACRSAGIAFGASLPASLGSLAPPPRLVRCRSCGGVTDPTGLGVSPRCRHCGADLRWSCPICRRDRLVDQPRCACGFPLASVEPLARHMQAAGRAYKIRDDPAALDHLDQARGYAPDHPDVGRALERVRRRMAEGDRARIGWESARAGRRVVEGREALNAWGRLVPASDPQLRAAWDDLARVVRTARDLANRARALETSDPAGSRKLYRDAVAIAADLPEVVEGLSRCPPDPPTSLRLDVLGDRVRLAWAPPAADGLGPIAYRVVRKGGANPVGPADGVVVAEVEATSAEDVGPPSGEPIGYAVFARRGETVSVAGASAGPILALAGVADLRVEARSGEVELRWSTPNRAASVRVVRKLGSPPIGPDDGSVVDATRESALDRNLDDDRAYHYCLFTEYRLEDGTTATAPGVSIAAVPHAPLEPPEPPTLTREPDGRARLEWRPPARGTYRILRTDRPTGLAVGVRLNAAEVDALAGHWLDPSAPGRAFDDEPGASGLRYYTPILGRAESWTVGRSAIASGVPDPADLRAVRAGPGGRVHLRWRWSPRGSQALVACKDGSPPIGPDDPEAATTIVSEGEYGRQGYYALQLPSEGRGPWHIAVYALATVEGERVASPGAEPSARTVVPGPNPEITVAYALHRPTFPGRPWSLTFRTTPPGSAVPATVLVARPRAVPLSADDGEIVGRFPEARDGSTFPVHSKLDLARHPARIFTDPRTDPANLPPIRLRHPEAGDARA